MSDEMMFMIGDDGKATFYDDTYDITIHCESKEEQDDALRLLKQPQRWIPVTERQPEYGAEVLTINTDGDYEINHIIDEEDAEWFFNGVIAWCELPEPYKEEKNG